MWSVAEVYPELDAGLHQMPKMPTNRPSSTPEFPAKNEFGDILMSKSKLRQYIFR